MTTGSVMLPRAPADIAPGTLVIRVDDYGFPHLTRTRSKPWPLGGMLVVMINGISGGYALDRIFVMPKAET